MAKEKSGNRVEREPAPGSETSKAGTLNNQEGGKVRVSDTIAPPPPPKSKDD